MSDRDPSSLTPPSAEHRRIATESFDRANQVLASGNYDYAIQLLKTCCKIDPSNMQYRQVLRRTQKAKYNNNMRGSRFALLTTSRHKAQLKVAKRSREYLRVLEIAEEILTRNPWDTGTLMDMAQAFEALHLNDLAIFSLDQARQKNPKDVTVNRALARLLEKVGRFSQAIKLWQLVREAAPDDVEAAHKAKDLAASETIQRGGYESSRSFDESAPGAGSGIMHPPANRSDREAERLLTQIEAAPTDYALYLELASVYRRANQADKARAVLQQGLAPTGSDPRILIEILELDLEPFRRKLAANDRRIEAREANPDPEDEDDDTTLDELHRMRHRLLKEINSRELELFRMRADRQPGEMSFRLELGIRLLRAERTDEAIVELQQARKDERLIGRATMYLGFCFKSRKNWRLAKRNFEEALEHIPPRDEEQRKEVLFQLAQGYAEAGELEQALEMGHELANLDFAYRGIGQLIDEWEARLREDAV